MNGLRRWWVGLALLMVLAPLILQVSAQGGELLQDPGFEGPYVNRGRATLNTPSAWNLWLADGPHNYDWQNRADKVSAFPHNTEPEKRSGNASLNGRRLRDVHSGGLPAGERAAEHQRDRQRVRPAQDVQYRAERR
ncbi:MAG: hypothetical protein U0521_00385 [Anaerolineae bacterium]